VIFFPPSDVFILRSSRELALAWGEPIVKSGRALIYPVYKGTYERQGVVSKAGANDARELRIAWSRDLGRVVDYLETRADMDLDQLTFYAVRASSTAVLLTALEPRVRYAVLQGAGIWIWNDVAPEIDAVNYAPRVRVPVLMLGVRYDFDHPVEPAQRPLFDLLGTPAEHKQHTILEMGHGIPVADSAKVILPWLDRYLGPASPGPSQ
jgi:eukaryotic-like serine/threonine-protein kinase